MIERIRNNLCNMIYVILLKKDTLMVTWVFLCLMIQLLILVVSIILSYIE